MEIESAYVELGDQFVDYGTLCDIYGEDDFAKVAAASGIRSLRKCSTSIDSFDLFKRLVERRELKNQIEQCQLLLVVSEHVSKIIPPPSALLLAGLDVGGALVLDLNRGCSGFVEALTVCSRFFGIDGAYQRACIICADNYSKYSEIENRTISSIFGDAASITFVRNSCHDSAPLTSYGTYPDKSHFLKYNKSSGISMIGPEIVKFVQGLVIPSVQDLVAQQSMKPDFYFVHQGSLLVVKSFRKAFGLADSECPFAISECGNLNSSSIPLILSENLNSLSGASVLFSGFGVGLSFCNMLYRHP